VSVHSSSILDLLFDLLDTNRASAKVSVHIDSISRVNR